MSLPKRFRWLLIAAAISGGTIFQTNGCAEYYVTSAASALDFCSVFNCSGGSFFDFCNPVPVFADCPNAGQAVEP
jgi:hypothetical protein